MMATKPIGQAEPFSKEMVTSLRQILRHENRLRDLALFCAHIDMCTRASDVLSLRVGDIRSGGRILSSLDLRQQKTGLVVQCKLYDEARIAIKLYLTSRPGVADGCFLFPGKNGCHLSVGQYQRLVKDWACLLRWAGVPLPDGYLSTHSVRRSKTAHIYAQTKDTAACMHLLGHSSLAATERYLGVNVKKAHEVAARFTF